MRVLLRRCFLASLWVTVFVAVLSVGAGVLIAKSPASVVQVESFTRAAAGISGPGGSLTRPLALDEPEAMELVAARSALGAAEEDCPSFLLPWQRDTFLSCHATSAAALSIGIVRDLLEEYAVLNFGDARFLDVLAPFRFVMIVVCVLALLPGVVSGFKSRGVGGVALRFAALAAAVVGMLFVPALLTVLDHYVFGPLTYLLSKFMAANLDAWLTSMRDSLAGLGVGISLPLGFVFGVVIFVIGIILAVMLVIRDPVILLFLLAAGLCLPNAISFGDWSKVKEYLRKTLASLSFPLAVVAILCAGTIYTFSEGVPSSAGGWFNQFRRIVQFVVFVVAALLSYNFMVLAFGAFSAQVIARGVLGVFGRPFRGRGRGSAGAGSGRRRFRLGRGRGRGGSSSGSGGRPNGGGGGAGGAAGGSRSGIRGGSKTKSEGRFSRRSGKAKRGASTGGSASGVRGSAGSKGTARSTQGGKAAGRRSSSSGVPGGAGRSSVSGNSAGGRSSGRSGSGSGSSGGSSRFKSNQPNGGRRQWKGRS